MGFGFGVFSLPSTSVYALGFGETAMNAGDMVLTEIVDSHGTYDGTTFTCPSNQSGLYLLTITGFVKDSDHPTANDVLTSKVNGVEDITAPETSNAFSHGPWAYSYARFIILATGDTVKGFTKGHALSQLANARLAIRKW